MMNHGQKTNGELMTTAKVNLITSSANPIYKQWKTLLSSKGLKKEGLFILSGRKLILEFIKDPVCPMVAEIIAPGGKSVTSAQKKYELSKELFEELDELGTHFNLLILEQPQFKIWNAESDVKGLEILCPIGDPSNLGAFIRSGLAFGSQRIILLKESAHPFLPKVIKASAGAVLYAPLYSGPSIENLNPKGLVALSGRGQSILNFKWPKNCRLLVGEEGPGLGDLDCETKIKIPTSNVESLNAVVATSIALFHFRLQHANIESAKSNF
jgi:RNA methyltransferase, TrmH family